MDSRRDFIKKAALLSAGTGLLGALPPAIQKAFAINPQTGSTYLDAEHIVVLMQENRSFDHCYGSLQGVRGYNDPRAVRLPNKNLVWLQSNAAGDTYAPFRLNLMETKSTWLGNLPHSWGNQVDARNGGRYDKWLDAKPSGNKKYADMPLTLGYYNRQDIPFYYSLADAFTICDQNFCSSLTGTTPNRLYLWSGTIKAGQTADSQACVMNEDADYDTEVSWKTFPERLEENGIAWKIYQNELSVGVGFEGEEDAWLANFGDNPLEYFTQYNVRFSEGYIKNIQKRSEKLAEEINKIETAAKLLPNDGKDDAKLQRRLKKLKEESQRIPDEQAKYTKANFGKLSEHEKNIHKKAFSTNTKDPHYHSLETLTYKDGDKERNVQVPKGDVLHEFREDVNTGKLPTVSWIVAPENFSDHPASPWYGSWYISEVMDILTKKPEVWQKTIFILCYDENDGYFDHVPPFVAPNPNDPNTGLVSKGIDAGLEFVTLEQDKRTKHAPKESSIGLGYRVPLVIASPWSRGGAVNSQVFDHTSIVQFMENFLNTKFGKSIKETNITEWRRTVCGDLSSVFKPYHGEKITAPLVVTRNEFVEDIHKAQFKKDPFGFKKLDKTEIEEMNKNALHELMPKQEKGTRVSNALPYELYVNGKLSDDKKSFGIQFKVGNEIFGKQAAGAPFNVHANIGKDVLVRNYAVKAGDILNDSWLIDSFENANYHLEVYGPNGFYRGFKGKENHPKLIIELQYQQQPNTRRNAMLHINNADEQWTGAIEVADNAYNTQSQQMFLNKNEKRGLILDFNKNGGWYDFSIKIIGDDNFEYRFAGRVETGKDSITDPFMGRVI